MRVAAIVALVLGLAVLALYLDDIGRVPWSPAPARHLRAMKERTAAPAAITPTTFAGMNALPRRAPLATYAAFERGGASLEGYVQRMERAPDGDIHLDFADRLDPDAHMIPYLSVELTPQWRRDSPRWRFERLVEQFRPYYGGPTRWDTPPRRVRVSGWLLYDYAFEGAPPVFGFPPHSTSWEIHPVTRIEVWNDSLARYVEFPR